MTTTASLPYGDEIHNILFCLKGIRAFLDQEKIESRDDFVDALDAIEFFLSLAMQEAQSAVDEELKGVKAPAKTE